MLSLHLQGHVPNVFHNREGIFTFFRQDPFPTTVVAALSSTHVPNVIPFMPCRLRAENDDKGGEKEVM